MEGVCDLNILLPLERELCPFDLAPVTSTVIQMLFGDTVAIALMQAKHLTRDEYAMNHPAGRIGRRLILRVADVMLKCADVPSVGPSTHVCDALGELSSKGCGCVLVVDDQRHLKGVFTDGDLRRALQSIGTSGNLMTTRVSDIMTKSPRTTGYNNKAAAAMDVRGQRLALVDRTIAVGCLIGGSTIVYALIMQEMEVKPKVTMLPVLDEEGRVEGLVTLHGLISAGL